MARAAPLGAAATAIFVSRVPGSLLTLCMLLLTVASLQAVPHDQHTGDGLWCNGEFFRHQEFCYRYFGYGAKRTFHLAEKLCKNYHSSLVSLHSQKEEGFVVQLSDNNSAFWIGLNDEDGPMSYHKEGWFKWTSGVDFFEGNSYQNWQQGEPNNKMHLDCVKADAQGWVIAQGGCGAARLPFICKKYACPPGLEWGGSDCDIISNIRIVPKSLVLHQLQVFFLPVCIFLLIPVSSLLFAVWVCCYHTRTSNTITPQPGGLHKQSSTLYKLPT